MGFAVKQIGSSMGGNFVVTNNSNQHSLSGVCPVNQFIISFHKNHFYIEFRAIVAQLCRPIWRRPIEYF
jgi:hypothetical protein